MYSHSRKNGYSLIEVLIAITILMMAIIAPMTIAIKSIQSSRYTLEQNTAIFLAQEAISILETLRNNAALENLNDNDDEFWDWTDELDDCETTHGCNFDARDPYALLDRSANIIACTEAGENCRLYYNETWSRSAYRINDTSGEPSPFIRRVYVESLSDNELNLRVVVEWDAGFLRQQQRITVTSSLFNLYGALISSS